MPVLIVEPMEEDRVAFTATLRAGGYADLLVVSAYDDALDKLGIGRSGPSHAAYGTELIVLGCDSAADCIEPCRRIKDAFHYQDVPIIVASTEASVEGMPLAFAHGAHDYVRKPFNDVEFLARVRAALRLKHEVDRRKARERELLEATRQLTDLNAMLTSMALMDGLTGVANRRNFDRCLEKEWRRAHRNKHDLALIMVDVDDFKAYNDHFGHQGGDDCLRKVASALKAGLRRPGDVLCRYAGAEFGVILPDTPLAGAKVVAENLRSALAAARLPHPKSRAGNQVTLSIGVAAAQPMSGLEESLLTIAAGKALYRAKYAGRNQVCAETETIVAKDLETA